MRLFVERGKRDRRRLRADRMRRSTDRRDLPAASTVSPSAIEFAAPRVLVLGVEGLAAGLDDSLRLLGAQRRAPVPRHRTMQAVADWSYGLLSEGEQRFFRALGIFAGGFACEATAAVCHERGGNSRRSDRPSGRSGGEIVGGRKCQRCQTPVPITQKPLAPMPSRNFDESGEREQITRCHAAYYRDLFERAEREVPARSPGDWQADYAPEIDNLRAALNWAFSPDGDGTIGVALTAAAVSLWRRLSLLEECRSRAKQALDALDALATTRNQDPYAEMRLQAALGASTSRRGMAASTTSIAYTRALAIAESIGDADAGCVLSGDCFSFIRRAATHRDRCGNGWRKGSMKLAASGRRSGTSRLTGENIMGMTKHFHGDLTGARRHLEHVLADHNPTGDGGYVVYLQDIIRFQIDGHVSARAFLARVLWFQGFPDQAVHAAELSIEEARATGHALSLCYALALAACPVALWVGNLATAELYTGLLVDTSRKHDLRLCRVRTAPDFKRPWSS